MKLISMTDFVLEQGKIKVPIDSNATTTWTKALKSVYIYADFLKQPLSLSMFVPCKEVDGKWVVLEEPKEEKIWRQEMGGIIYQKTFKEAVEEYQQAKKRVFFEGFVNQLGIITNGKTQFSIGSIRNGGYSVEMAIHPSITLTPNTQKQLGL